MKGLILRVSAVLLVIGAAPLSPGVAEWREGALTDYFLEPDCEHRECVPSNPGEECCIYWV